jgi:hypothetical protein
VEGRIHKGQIQALSGLSNISIFVSAWFRAFLLRVRPLRNSDCRLKGLSQSRMIDARDVSQENGVAPIASREHCIAYLVTLFDEEVRLRRLPWCSQRIQRLRHRVCRGAV